jgi:hypothetical protein
MKEAAGSMPSGLTGLKSISEKLRRSPGPNSKSQPVSFVEREPVGPKPKFVGLLQLIHSLSTAPPGWRQLARHIWAHRMLRRRRTEKGQDLMVLLRQLSCDSGPDKSGRASDKDLHHVSFEIKLPHQARISHRCEHIGAHDWKEAGDYLYRIFELTTSADPAY